MSGLRFWWTWYQLGRAYWKARHLWTLMAWLDSAQDSLPVPARSVTDEIEAWLAEHGEHS